MGRESQLGKTVRLHVAGVWHRIENGVGPGMPDLVGVVGGRTVFVELKSLRAWKGDLGVSPVQRLWQAQWWASGGTVFTLVKCEGVVYLVRGDKLLRSGTRADWSRASSYVSHTRVDWKEIERCLTYRI